MDMKKAKLKLIKTDSYEGYYAEDIKAALTPEEFKKFGDWFAGQTGAIHDGKLLVYKWDWDRYNSKYRNSAILWD